MHVVVKRLQTVNNKVKEIISEKQLKTAPQIIAVSKTFSLNQITPLLDFGHLHFGENKVQEAYNKFKDLKTIHKNIYLHMIGPLQTNKVKKALEIFDFFHSLDRPNLALEFSKYSNNIKHKSFFIQINTGNEKQKSGILSNLASEFIQHCLNTLKLNIIGLMCLPPINEDPKPHFLVLKELATKNKIKHLSMGMSNDYQIAVDNGATFIRVGSNLFGFRK